MAVCTDIPTPDGVCLDYLYFNYPLYNASIWNQPSPPIEELSPQWFGCDIFMYVGDRVISDGIGSGLTYVCDGDEFPPFPEETLTEVVYATLGGVGICSDGADCLAIAVREISATNYRWENGGTLSAYCPDEIRWNLVWDVYEAFHFYLVAGEEYIPICPEGMEFDPLLGYCVILPGWEEDPENPGTYIPIPCLELSGEENLDRLGTYTYTLRLKEADIYGELQYVVPESDFYAYISSVNSTALNGIHFTLPSKVFFLEGQLSATFNLEVLDSMNGLTFNINIDSIYKNCNQLLFNTDFDPEYIFSDRTSCCAYYTQSYLAWQSCTRIPSPKYPGLMREDGTVIGSGEY